MPNKRGRPISGESDSAGVNYRRELERERQRRRRERLRTVGITRRVERVLEQLEQGEQIIDLPTIAEENAAAT
jgi:ABC-type molybdenum transport system ATPase subunit/photorepair protein PhrA